MSEICRQNIYQKKYQTRMSQDISERMPERMPEIMLAKDVKRYVIRYIRKECQKECQNRLSEDMSEKDIRRYVRKGCQKIRPKKCHKERLYWTVSIEFQVPRPLKTDIAIAIPPLYWLSQIVLFLSNLNFQAPTRLQTPRRCLGVSSLARASEIILNQV